MTLPFSDKFPWGEPTYFEEKLAYIKWLSDYECFEIQNRIGFKPKPKLHTIRQDLCGRWRAGRSVQGFYGSRTKNMRKIFDGECKSIQRIKIKYEDTELNVFIHLVDDIWNVLNDNEIEELAVNDGFNNAEHFFRYFHEDFEGKIIHFTDLKY